MKTSFTTLGCPDWSIDDIIANGNGFGFDAVELRTNGDGVHFSPDSDLETAREAGEKFREGGLPVASVMGYSRFAFEDAAQVAENTALLSKLVDVAHAMGAPYVRTFAGQIPEGVDRNAMVETVAKGIAPCARKAADLGVTIGLETHDDWCSGERVMNVVEMIDSDGFGVVYDIFNAITTGIETWDQTYALVKDRICYCHLKDGYKGGDGKLHYTMVGAGDLPFGDVLARLKADGYDSYISFEWEKMWHAELEEPERAFPHFVHKLGKVWEEV